MTKVYNNATDLITFARSSSGTALRRVGYGDELVTNGTFDTDTDWTKGTGWTISGGVASKDNTATSTDYLEQTLSLVDGAVYEVSFTISNITSGSNMGVSSSGAFGDVSSSERFLFNNGTRTFTAVYNASTGSSLRFVASSTSTTMDIDNISIREVIFDRATDPLVLYNHLDDTPRIEYAADGSLKGLLIEEARTNLVPYSRPQAAHWSTTGTSVAENVGTAPDGTASASRITVSSATLFHFAAPVTVPAMGASPYTVSCFLKADTVNNASLFLTQGGNNGAVFSLTGSGSVSSVSGTGNTAEISEAGNGWYRCSVTNDGGADLTDQLRIGVANGALDSYAGNGTDSILAWGFQLEQGSFATSYIPTAGSTVTRSADIASIPVSAFGYNQEAGTVVVSFDTFQDPADAGSRFVASVDTGGRFCYVNGDYAKAYDGTNVISGGRLHNPGSFTTATAFGSSGISMSLDGGSAVTGSFDGSWGSGSDLMLGHLSNASQLNGHIKSIQYFPRRLTDAQLQELTS